MYIYCVNTKTRYCFKKAGSYKVTQCVFGWLCDFGGQPIVSDITVTVLRCPDPLSDFTIQYIGLTAAAAVLGVHVHVCVAEKDTPFLDQVVAN